MLSETERTAVIDGVVAPCTEIRNSTAFTSSNSLLCSENAAATTEIEKPLFLRSLSGDTQQAPPSQQCEAHSFKDSVLKNAGKTASSRERFRNYWEYAQAFFGATEAGMMLKRDVHPSFAALEREEILSALYDELKNRVVDVLLELGAGIGRFTPYLFPLAHKLIAIDLIQRYIEKNKAAHALSSRPQDEFLCADALHVSYPVESIDVVFWNWLLMYLNDSEVVAFVARVVSWLKPGGYLFCRESCEQPSNSDERPWALEGNPTCYRQGRFYTQLFTKIVPSLTGVRLNVVFKERSIHAYDDVAPSAGQLAWFVQKSF